MITSPIRIPLTEAAVAEIMDALTARSARLLGGEPDEPYSALERRWREIGGMIEACPRARCLAPGAPAREPQGRPASADGNPLRWLHPLAALGPASAGPSRVPCCRCRWP